MTALQENGVPGNSIDFLYVDEAQDNLMIDAACELLVYNLRQDGH